MDSSTSHPGWLDARYIVLWTGVLAGPVVWLSLLELNYVLAHVACQTQTRWFLHLAIGVAVVLVAMAAYASWSVQVEKAIHQSPDHARTPPDSAATREQQLRWMRLAGLVISAWFVLVILAMEIPLIVLEECR